MSPIRVTYCCGGCFAEQGPYYDEHGRFRTEPRGWVLRDPYTGCVYCPDCWADVIGPLTEAEWEDPARASVKS